MSFTRKIVGWNVAATMRTDILPLEAFDHCGASTARDVVVDAGEFASVDDRDHITADIGGFLRTPKTLVPGARRRVMWSYRHVDSDGAETRRAGVFGSREATISYGDDRTATRRWRSRIPYTAKFVLEDAANGNVMPAPTTGAKSGSGDLWPISTSYSERSVRTSES